MVVAGVEEDNGSGLFVAATGYERFRFAETKSLSEMSLPLLVENINSAAIPFQTLITLDLSSSLFAFEKPLNCPVTFKKSFSSSTFQVA